MLLEDFSFGATKRIYIQKAKKFSAKFNSTIQLILSKEIKVNKLELSKKKISSLLILCKL